MVCERLEDLTERLKGGGILKVRVPISERFFTSSLKILNAEEVIAEILKNLEYRLVIFITINRGIYTVNEDTFVEEACKVLESGNPTLNGRVAYLFDSISLDDALMYAEQVLGNGEKAAVILPFWEALQTGADTGTGSIVERLTSLQNSVNLQKENLLIVIENSETIRKTDENNEDAIPSVSIPFPFKDEVRRLIHYQRLAKEKPLEWEDEERLVKCLLREPEPLSGLIKKTNTYPKLSISDVGEKCAINPWEELNALIGLDEVKEEIKKYVKQFKNLERRHLAFTGNPGVGKTTVARILAAILAEEGCLKKGHLVECGSSDLIGQYVGETRQKVRKKFEEALGGILFIDEAYALNDEHPGSRGSFGREAIDEITRLMDLYKDQLVVIFAGYRQETLQFLNANTGLPSRVREITFQDYNKKELEEVFYKKIETKRRKVSDDLKQVLPHIFEEMYEDVKSGIIGTYVNARGVENLIDRLIVNAGNSEVLKADHLPREWMYFVKGIDEDLMEEVEEEFRKLIGLRDLKNYVDVIAKVRRNEFELFKKGIIKKINRPRSLHFLFKGNPGTGKTTAAKLIGKVLKALYLLPSDNVTVTKPAEIISPIVGESEKNLINLIKGAKGGVLFIDEAGSLESAKDLLSTLIAEMENRKRDFSLILAGYPDVIDKIKKRDPGMESRIMAEIEFKDFNEDELWEIFKMKVAEKGYDVDEEAKRTFIETVRRLKVKKGNSFGNARDMEKLAEEIVNRKVRELDVGKVKEKSEIKITSEDISKAEKKRIEGGINEWKENCYPERK